MTLKNFLELYDNWNGITRVDDNKLNKIVEGKTVCIYEENENLHRKKVVSFGFYDGELTIRVK